MHSGHRLGSDDHHFADNLPSMVQVDNASFMTRLESRRRVSIRSDLYSYMALISDRRIHLMETSIGGFAFNDFCQRCQRVAEHAIIAERKEIKGKCSICSEKRLITEVSQLYYSNTDLWVTRFKIGNLTNVVTGKLLDTVRHLGTQ